jgi:hypothetical protein
MFMRYIRTRVGRDATRYRLAEKPVSLAGINNGIIPRLLQPKVPPRQGSKPYRWHIDVVHELGAHPDYPANSTLIIDLKPNQSDKLSLYEILDVWGYTYWKWSPILLRLAGLFMDEDPRNFNRKRFVRKDGEIETRIYEWLRLDGYVQRGRLAGPWTFPRPNPTNAAVLWPDVMRYFVECIRSRTPDVLSDDGR